MGGLVAPTRSGDKRGERCLCGLSAPSLVAQPAGQAGPAFGPLHLAVVYCCSPSASLEWAGPLH